MKVMDIIQKIEALPEKEMKEIFQYVHKKEAGNQNPVNYADEESFKKAAKAVLEENKELLHKLAQ